MTVILLGLGDTLSAVIIVTVVRGGGNNNTTNYWHQIINLKTSTFLNLHTIMHHHSPLNGHNPQCTVLICPESLLNDRTRPRQERRPESLIQTSNK